MSTQATAGLVRVLIFAAAPPDRARAVEEAYHAISRELRGTPGLIGNELLRSTTAPGEYVVMSEWETLEAFQRWEAGPGHRASTSPLRPFQHPAGGRGGQSFGIYQVSATY
jgi:heme-degrading monooxygenase HmoA